MSAWPVRVEYEGGEYVTEYRTIKGDAAQSEMCLDLEDLSDTLDELCGPCFECEQPVYEL